MAFVAVFNRWCGSFWVLYTAIYMYHMCRTGDSLRKIWYRNWDVFLSIFSFRFYLSLFIFNNLRCTLASSIIIFMWMGTSMEYIRNVLVSCVRRNVFDKQNINVSQVERMWKSDETVEGSNGSLPFSHSLILALTLTLALASAFGGVGQFHFGSLYFFSILSDIETSWNALLRCFSDAATKFTIVFDISIGIAFTLCLFVLLMD